MRAVWVRSYGYPTRTRDIVPIPVPAEVRVTGGYGYTLTALFASYKIFVECDECNLFIEIV